MRVGEYMESAISSKKIMFKFFMLLFAMNVSFSVLPGSIVSSYGLFGEVASFSAEENQESGIQTNPNKRNSNKRSSNKRNLNKNNLKKRVIPLSNKKRQKVQYAWLIIILIAIPIYYLQYRILYTDDVTPVGLKVRMNN